MERRTPSWYSIVRYCSDSLTGEIVNVGVIMHAVGDAILTKFLLIDENSPKIRAITHSNVEVNIYKSFKDTLEYYLKKSIDNPFGAVGELQIASPTDENFLKSLYEYYKDKKMFLTPPKFSLTSDFDRLFISLFETYVGKKYLNTEENKHVSVKRYMKNIFEEKQLLDKKVAHDFTITPIKELEHIKINIDFGYKNGVWNYLQAVPQINGPSKNTEWFAKTKFMFENLDQDIVVHLMYRSSEINNKKQFFDMINYLMTLNSKVIRLDLDDKKKVEELCEKIEKDAHDIDELLLA